MQTRFMEKFNQYLRRFNTDYVAQAISLCCYHYIHMDIKDKLTQDDLRSAFIRFYIDGHEQESILLGQLYHFKKKSYIKCDIEDLFFSYKIALNFPNERVYECLKPHKTREKLLLAFEGLYTQLAYPSLDSEQLALSKKYREHYLFKIKHMLSYLSTNDHDFLNLGNKLFKNFSTIENNQKIINLIPDCLNSYINGYISSNPTSQDISQRNDIVLNDLRIKHLFNAVEKTEKLNLHILNKTMNSYEKGYLGEHTLGGIIGAEIVGHKNNKVDLVGLNGEHISLKTSYNGTWNHHLAYLNKEQVLIDAINSKTPLYQIKNIDWQQIVEDLICGNENIQELVFQKITMDEQGVEPIDNKVWRLKTASIITAVKNKQFIFQGNNIIVFHENEQVFKINIKKRSDKIQIMIITSEESLNNAMSKNFCENYHIKEHLSPKNI